MNIVYVCFVRLVLMCLIFILLDEMRCAKPLYVTQWKCSSNVRMTRCNLHYMFEAIMLTVYGLCVLSTILDIHFQLKTDLPLNLFIFITFVISLNCMSKYQQTWTLLGEYTVLLLCLFVFIWCNKVLSAPSRPKPRYLWSILFVLYVLQTAFQTRSVNAISLHNYSFIYLPHSYQ